MPEAKSQIARRMLVTVVASYDNKTVKKSAVENSDEFRAFLAKVIDPSVIDDLDYADIIAELEDTMGIEIPSRSFKNWQEFFNELVTLLDQD